VRLPTVPTTAGPTAGSSLPLWVLLQHVANHSTHHRSEVATMLIMVPYAGEGGKEPLVLDEGAERPSPEGMAQLA
jgi:uncharacterized damage-inducible protein DinB